MLRLTDVNAPIYLMALPNTASSREPNNIYMSVDAPIDQPTAIKQWKSLYNYISANAIVYLLPSTHDLQDLVYTANAGCYLPHIRERDIFILSNFRSYPRKGEEKVIQLFIESLPYEVYKPTSTFEGEADLKYVRDNIYIGGYSGRTDIRTLWWLEETFGLKIIPIRVNDPKLFHLDCLLFRLTENKVLVTTDAITKSEKKSLEEITEIVAVPDSLKYNYDITNLVRVGNAILFKQTDDKQAIRFIEKVCDDCSFILRMFDLDEFSKGGAGLSCLVSALNYR
jgi:N-dimethylarginine dimethylaminohydrolase